MCGLLGTHLKREIEAIFKIWFGGHLENSTNCKIIWIDYLKYRAKLRGFDLEKIEEILRYSDERYFDVVTRRQIAIWRYADRVVMIPHERSENLITPVTMHVINRQQIKFRLKTGRFINE